MLGTRPEALAKQVRRLSSLPLRRLPTRCCEGAGRSARAPRVGFGPFRSRKPARGCLCAASAVLGCRVSLCRDDVLTGLHVCSVWCCLRLCARVCFTSALRSVPLPQARSRVPVRCICCDAGFCMMPGEGDGRAACAIGGDACVRLRRWRVLATTCVLICLDVCNMMDSLCFVKLSGRTLAPAGQNKGQNKGKREDAGRVPSWMGRPQSALRT